MSCPNRKAAVCKTGREPLPGPESAEALILDFGLNNCGEITFCCMSHPVCGTLSRWPEQTNIMGVIVHVEVLQRVDGQSQE